MNFKILLIILTLAVMNSIYAQTGIGTNTPDASAKLEIASSNKGFLPPRVALTATNSTSPITNPANGLMVFNTVTAGTNPYQVVPGYYYWDGLGLKWVSLSTTVGNVQNQAIFRSTSNTTAGSVVSTWNSRFNNIASGDLTIVSNTTFALSNGVYKIQWGLPHQQAQTYNVIQLQENSNGNWNAWLGDANYASIANGGGTDWGGTTFMTDVVDCSSNIRTFRLINTDGSRSLFYGASFIITKLNPAITTSTTADNLGNHTATKNLQLSGNYISNDGGNEGIRIDNSGNVGIGTTTPGTSLQIENGNAFGADPSSTTSPSLYIYNNNNASTTAHSSLAIRTNGNGGGNPYLSFDLNGVRGVSMGIDNADGDKFKIQNNWSLNNLSTPVLTITADNKVGIGNNAPTQALDVTGNVNITGKINVTDPSGNVVKKVAGFVNAGDYIILDNLKVRVAPSGNRSLQVATVSGTYTVFGSDLFSANGPGGSAIFENNKLTITTNPAYLNAGLSFAWGGYTDTWTIMDTNSFIAWRITCIIGNSYGAFANFISIERLL
jgi:hypothetical protein